MSVVISPNGLNAPPALAATTTLMQATTTNFGRSRPTASATAPRMRAVVRLSAIGEMTNASPPVIQKIARRLNPRPASCERRAAKTPRSPERVHEGHRGEQEQHQLGVVQQVAPECLLGQVRLAPQREDHGHQDPDRARRDERRDRLAQVQALLEHDEGIRQHEDREARVAPDAFRSGPCRAGMVSDVGRGRGSVTIEVHAFTSASRSGLRRAIRAPR